MAARLRSFRKDRAGIVGFVMPGGAVYGVTEEILADSVKFARGVLITGNHIRSGRLYNSIGYYKPKTVGTSKVEGQVHANARHALWVEDGTQPWFNSKKMVIPRNRQAGSISGTFLLKTQGKSAVFFAYSRQGQKGVHYLEKGLNAAIREFRTFSPRISVPRPVRGL